MYRKYDLVDWLYESLKKLEGSASITDVCKQIWMDHEQDLKKSGDLFYTWRYDIRWAAFELRKKGLMKSSNISSKGIWELSI